MFDKSFNMILSCKMSKKFKTPPFYNSFFSCLVLICNKSTITNHLKFYDFQVKCQGEN